MISSFSLPLAVSKLVSARMATGQRKAAVKLFKGAMIFATISGLIVALIVFFGSDALASAMQTPFSAYSLRVLAPTLFIVALMGTIRGFFQGLGTTVPSAISQIVEQIVNAIISIVASYILFSYGGRVGEVMGDSAHYAAAYGAAGGSLGTCIGAVAGLFFVSFVFFAFRERLKNLLSKDTGADKESYKTVLKVVVLTVVPVLLSTTIYNISSIVNQFLFKNIAIYQNYSPDDLNIWWGVFTGKYKLLTNVPIAISSALASSSVPSLAAAFAQKQIDILKGRIALAIKFTMMIAIPCCVGIFVLASPLMQLLFNDSSDLVRILLQVGALAVVFYSLSTISNGILQGIDKMRIPVTNAIYALIIQVGLLLLLMFVFKMSIVAVVLAHTFYAILMSLLNGMAIKKYVGYTQEIKKTFIIPAISAVLMGVFIFFIYKLLMMITHHNSIATIISIIAGMISYAIIMLLLKGINREELANFPKGNTLIKLFDKIHLLK